MTAVSRDAILERVGELQNAMDRLKKLFSSRDLALETETIPADTKAFRRRLIKERESLQELCGGLGHVWKQHGFKECMICDASNTGSKP